MKNFQRNFSAFVKSDVHFPQKMHQTLPAGNAEAIYKYNEKVCPQTFSAV